MNDTYATVLFIGASIIVVFLQVLRTVLNKRLKKGKLTRQDWQPFILLLAAIIFVLLLFEHSFIPQYHLSFISTPLVIINGVLLVFLFGCILLASWRGDDRATHTAMIQE